MSSIAEAYARRAAAPARGIGAAYAARFKEWDESLHPRVQGGPNAGEFTSAGGGGGMGDIIPPGPAGDEGRAVMAEHFDALENAPGPLHEIPGVGSAYQISDPASDAKIGNVFRIGDALVARAASDPALQSQLEAVGQRVIDTGRTPPTISQVDTQGNFDKLPLSDEHTTPYMVEHLGYAPGSGEGVNPLRGFGQPALQGADLLAALNPAEVGAREIAAKLQDSWMTTATDDSPLSWGLQLAVADKLGVDKTPALDYLQGKTWFDNTGVSVGVPMSGPHDPSENMAQYVQRIADSPAVKAYVDQVYSDTQAQLTEMGLVPGEMTLYRGVGFDEESNPFAVYHDQTTGELRNVTSTRTAGGGVEYGTSTTAKTVLNPLSSFSTDEGKAMDFMRSQVEDHGGVNAGGIGYIISATIPTERIFSYAETGPGCLGERELLVVGGPARVTIDDGGTGLTMIGNPASADGVPGAPDMIPAFPVGSDPAYRDPSLATQDWPVTSDSGPVTKFTTARVKEWNEELHPRDERGRFTESSAGSTEAGLAGNNALGKLVMAASTAASLAKALSPRDALKQANVIAAGDRLVAAAESVPGLAAELDRAGANFISKLTSVDGDVYQKTLTDRLGIGLNKYSSDQTPYDSRLIGARSIANTLQTSWAGTSSDNTPMSVGSQLAVAEQFGLQDATSVLDATAVRTTAGRELYWNADEAKSVLSPIGADQAAPRNAGSGPDGMYTIKDLTSIISTSPAVTTYVSQTYDTTQAALKDAGITDVTLWRGMTFDPKTMPEELKVSTPSTVTGALAPLSSFSASPRIASTEFALGPNGRVIEATVPAERVYSIPSTGIGCVPELEVVLLGGKMNVKVTA